MFEFVRSGLKGLGNSLKVESYFGSKTGYDEFLLTKKINFAFKKVEDKSERANQLNFALLAAASFLEGAKSQKLCLLCRVGYGIPIDL